MFRLSLRNVWARKGRLLLTALAIIAGTAFLSGVFVFSDTIKGSFDSLFTTAYSKTDAFVRSADKVESDFGDATRGRVPDSLVPTVRAVPGVASANGDVQGFALVTSASGTNLGNGNAPNFGGSFSPDSTTTPWAVVQGRAATNGTEVVLDKQSSDTGKVKIGDTVKITAKAGVQDFTVVGIAKFAGHDSSLGATWALFDLPTAQAFVAQDPGKVDAIVVGGDGSVSQTTLAQRIEAALGPDSKTETLTGQQITAENQSQIEKGLSFFKTVLSIFALISLAVGSFIIYNVFSISAAQRQRENALLRAIGASSGQVTRSMLAEALAVGIGGSLLGFVGGLGLATGITRLLDAIGLGLSDSSLTVKPNAFVYTMVAGIAVTLACGVAPALRAGKVPPLAALRDVSVDRSDISRSRLVVGFSFLVIAVLAIIGGLTGTTILLAIGVIALFVTLIALGPLFAGPFARLATPALTKVRGVVGAIAGRNASRNPKRVALTAGALGVGLALLVGVAALGSSIKSSIRETVGQQFLGQYTITGSGSTAGSEGVLPLTVAASVAKLPEVAGATGVGAAQVHIANAAGQNIGKLVALIDPVSAAKTINLTFVSGGWNDLTADALIVSKSKADAEHLVPGDVVQVGFLDGTTTQLTIRGVFDDKNAGVLSGNFIADRQLAATTGVDVFDAQIYIVRAPGVSDAQATAAIESVVKNFPSAKFQTREQFISSQTNQVDTLLNVIYALLAMSIFIAVLGIVITLLLSVYERRRELGLMRAIGTTRAQVRGSVRWEAVLTALIGTAMGVGLGIALGWIVVKALADQGLNSFTLPVQSIVVFAVVAVVLAVLAAWLPARRAAKADILAAIATT
ncbi:MAG: transporter substrate-binding protein [Ilumatobacteraceae bacterium]|nr:transporter substrate-binding protein [Ilumatobacteraceae bacterium]